MFGGGNNPFGGGGQNNPPQSPFGQQQQPAFGASTPFGSAPAPAPAFGSGGFGAASSPSGFGAASTASGKARRIYRGRQLRASSSSSITPYPLDPAGTSGELIDASSTEAMSM